MQSCSSSSAQSMVPCHLCFILHASCYRFWLHISNLYTCCCRTSSYDWTCSSVGKEMHIPLSLLNQQAGTCEQNTRTLCQLWSCSWSNSDPRGWPVMVGYQITPPVCLNVGWSFGWAFLFLSDCLAPCTKRWRFMGGCKLLTLVGKHRGYKL